MQKFLRIFITVCAVLIGAISAIKLFYGEGALKMSGDYLKDVGAIARQTGVIMNDLAPYFTNQKKASTEELLNMVSKRKEEMVQLNQQAKGLDSPANMQNIHQQFVNSLDNYVTAFELTEQGLQNGEEMKINQASEFLMKGVTQMQDVSKGIEDLARGQK